jgi:CMP-N-acetylneuraminic acid synthetase
MIVASRSPPRQPSGAVRSYRDRMDTSGWATSDREVVAIIPARGGSKGVPGKNLREVGGITLIARAVGAALCTELVDRVVVTTDDPDIERIAVAEGADVVRRPPELSGDTASSESALLHALESIDGRVDVLVFLQATSPFIRPGDLDVAITTVTDGRHDVVFSAVQSHGFLWREGERGVIGVNHDASVRLRRQDRDPEFLETGAFYVMDAAGFRRAGFRFFGSVGIVEVDQATALEIDTEFDLELARALAPAFDRRIPATLERN